jgi:hypothetical protein
MDISHQYLSTGLIVCTTLDSLLRFHLSVFINMNMMRA